MILISTFADYLQIAGQFEFVSSKDHLWYCQSPLCTYSFVNLALLFTSISLLLSFYFLTSYQQSAVLNYLFILFKSDKIGFDFSSQTQYTLLILLIFICSLSFINIEFPKSQIVRYQFICKLLFHALFLFIVLCHYQSYLFLKWHHLLLIRSFH